MTPPPDLAWKDIAAEGFWYFETFPEILDNWDQRGKLEPLIAEYKVPFLSGYITGDLVDPSKRKDEITRITRLANVVKKFKGSYIVLAPNGVNRNTYNFQEHRADVISALNDYAAAITDLGLQTGLHQHTGTAICDSLRDEVYAVMDAVNTKNMKFAPDVRPAPEGWGGCSEGCEGLSASCNSTSHLKDYKGWQYYGGYCPLGMGMVDIPAILKMDGE